MANILENMYRFASRPVRDAIELANLSSQAGKVNRVELPTYTNKQLQALGSSEALNALPEMKKYKTALGQSNQAYTRLQNYEPVALKQEEMEGLLDYDRALKDAAIAGSFMMPGVGSGLGGAVASGAIGGALGGYGGSKRGEELTSTLTGGAIGAGAGALGYGLKQLANNLKNTKVNPKMIKGSASKVGMTPEEFKGASNKLLQEMSDAGFDVSSPKNIANNYPKYLSSIQKNLNKVSSLIDETPDLSQIKSIYDANLEFIGSSSTGIPGKFKKLTETLLNNPNPTYDDVINYKEAIDTLGGGFDKVQKSGKPFLAQLMKEVRTETRSVASNNTILDDALQSFNNALNMKNVVLKNPEIAAKVGLNAIVARTSLNTRPISDALRKGGTIQQGTRGMISKGSNILGNLLTSEGPISITGPLIGAGTLGANNTKETDTSQQNIETSENNIESYIDPSTGFLIDPSPAVTSPTISGTTSNYTLQDGLRDAASIFPNASESELLSLAQALVEQNTPKELSTQDRAVKSALSIIDEMGNMVNNLNLSESQLGAAVGGRLQSAYGALIPASDAGVFKTTRKGIVSRISRTLGEVGTLSDKDIQRAIDLIPDLTDTPESAQEKLTRLKNLVSSYSSDFSSISSDYESWNE